MRSPTVENKTICLSLNTPKAETTQEAALCAIREVTNRHGRWTGNKDVVHLLLSLPTDRQVHLHGSKNEISEQTLRRLQFENYADSHPTINSKNFCCPESNAAIVEVYSPGELYTILQDFVERSARLPVKHLSIVFNSHGTKDGKLLFWNGLLLHMDDILTSLQIFRQETCHRRGQTNLQTLHVIFAQCYSHKLNWTAVVKLDLITDVISLANDEQGDYVTHNVKTSDGKVVHQELMDFRSQVFDFPSLKQRRRVHEMECRIADLERTLETSGQTVKTLGIFETLEEKAKAAYQGQEGKSGGGMRKVRSYG